jgi:hypothetical protein
MAICLGLVLLGIGTTLGELLDSKTCWELFPICKGFLEVPNPNPNPSPNPKGLLEVELVATTMSLAITWSKYQLLLLYGADPHELGPQVQARDRHDSYGPHNQVADLA